MAPTASSLTRRRARASHQRQSTKRSPRYVRYKMGRPSRSTAEQTDVPVERPPKRTTTQQTDRQEKNRPGYQQPARPTVPETDSPLYRQPSRTTTTQQTASLRGRQFCHHETCKKLIRGPHDRHVGLTSAFGPMGCRSRFSLSPMPTAPHYTAVFKKIQGIWEGVVTLLNSLTIYLQRVRNS